MPMLTGVVTIKIDGAIIRSKEGATLENATGFEREGKTWAGGVAGFRKKPTIPSIKCTLSHDVQTSLTSLGAIDDATINFECDSGPIYSLFGAWLANDPGIGGEGEVELEFQGQRVEEQL